ncbi:glutathione hydrolase 1 proenzyme-like isoform X1 [Pimephales promelas]|uniref:glutathione hydrolase 1 proenzyme-like isoform X1 n=1 Tax=Pimephales promelas TaxID=90988 RepID=UPI0019558212|nr:glutathione hydrolase 1 proenzyme-like isoform X1 [Pimephales promelas]KAG1955836.1 glutathione hydrolase 1 proenzyme [Pimephales promelas]
MKKRNWFAIGIAVFLLALILTLSLLLTKRSLNSQQFTPLNCYAKSAVAEYAGECSDNCYAKAAVAADAEVCSEIGRDMLKLGGSAVDAAIAALLCVGVVNPQSMGIGGGVVFTIYNASTGTVETINARETAPMGASQNMFDNVSETGKGLYIAVPGELRGYQMAHDRYGKLPWRKLFEPSIKLASEGIQIGKALAVAINETCQTILNNTALWETFCGLKENDTKTNETLKQFPKLSHTYQRIANEGPDIFYNGSLNILDDIKAAGGNITLNDLKNYEVKNESALNFTVGNYIFHAPDAPFGGPVLALIFNILEGYNISSSNVTLMTNKTLMFHRMIEAFRFADAQKSKLGDPDAYENINELVRNMTSVSFAEEIWRKINDSIKQTSYGDINIVPDDHGTSHLSIIAEDGSAVAVTSSINDYFGSEVMSNSTGIIFNNQMKDFSTPRDKNVNKNNLIKPGKRPLSSKCPTIILDKQSGQVKMVVGGAGGTNITTAVAQVILNYLFLDYNLTKAVAEPRVQIPENVTNVEKDFDEEVREGLVNKNHEIGNKTELTVVQAVVREGDSLCAESDERGGGRPAGY